MEQMIFPGFGDEETAKSLITNLLDQSRLYHLSKDYIELLDFVARLPNFAPFNAFLLNLQKPGLRFAASQYDLQKRFQREVKEGSRPLLMAQWHSFMIWMIQKGSRFRILCNMLFGLWVNFRKIISISSCPCFIEKELS